MRSHLAWTLTAVLVCPGLVFLASVGDPAVYFRDPVPPGQTLYVLSKVIGLYALVVLWLQVMSGGFRELLVGRFGPQSLATLHGTLGLAGLALVLIHIGLFTAAVSLRSGGEFPVELLLPDLSGAYYPRMVSLGALAIYGLLIAIAVAVARHTRWLRGLWRRLHLVTYVVFFLALLHGLTIGSETRIQPLFTLYLLFGVTGFFAAAAPLLRLVSANLRRWHPHGVKNY